jgi:hypothetical protein
MDRTISTVTPDQDGAFTIRFAECDHETTGVSSPVACGLGQGDRVPCHECAHEAHVLLDQIEATVQRAETELGARHPVTLQLAAAWHALFDSVVPA